MSTRHVISPWRNTKASRIKNMQFTNDEITLIKSAALNRSDERKEERARVIRAQERARMNKHDSRVSETDRAIDELISQ